MLVWWKRPNIFSHPGRFPVILIITFPTRFTKWFYKLIEAEWCIYTSENKATIDSHNDMSPFRRQAIIWTNSRLLYLPHNKVVGGYIGFTPSVCLSVRPSVRLSVHPSRVRPASHVRSVAPTVLVGSISFLYILPSNFRSCVACKAFCKISIFGNFFKFVILTLS